jgi:cytochrome P450
VQNKLRQELATVNSPQPTYDELSSLRYLDFVVREVLRVHAPVTSTMRAAVEDDIIPLANPVTDKNGNIVDKLQ